ncbi:hypothetical protein [Deinococcus sp. KSM4-11]|uniref:RCC1 domain-containing protein n=1 Tax=Deinococcus sp. KSM4-11 TaxID=2568654 RepID=UPI001454E1EE|nr:hypothetical protein [Deinococcus sp. KSM4-11]
MTLSKAAKIDTRIDLSSNSQNATVLPSVTVKQGQTSATFQVLTNTNGIATGGSSVATIQAFSAQNYQAQLTIQNVNNASLTLSSTSVEPGQSVTGTVGLTGTVAVDTVVPLDSNSPNVTVPASVTVKAGQSSATFPIATNATGLAYGAKAVAIVTAGSAQSQLTVTRVGLTSLTFSPRTLVLGKPATGTVTRATPAPVDTDIPLSSNNARVAVPPKVTIPKGQTSATFPLSSSALGPYRRAVATVYAANVQTGFPLQGFAGVSVGFNQACALKANGTLTCWGNNDAGQLNVAGLSGVTQASLGIYHSCASKNDGTVACLGDRTDNQTSVPAGLSGVVQLDAGSWATCASKSDGTVACWGAPNYGQLNVPAGLSGVAEVDTGKFHVCALIWNGTVTCWADNFYGQANVPAGLSGVTQLSAGDIHNCALKNDGTVACWGDNSQGELNVPAGLSGVTQVSAGGGSTCALKGDGTVVCWGDNSQGQLNVPAGLAGVVQLSVGGQGSCAVKVDGTVVCWGQGSVIPPAGLNLLGS